MIPLWGLHLGFSESDIGILVGLGSIAPVLLSVHTGSFVDRVGPVRAFLVGIAISAAVAFLLLAATTFAAIAVLQLILGASRNLGWLSSQTYATALESEEVAAGRAPGRTGRFASVANFGTLIGPLLVGLAVDEIGTRWGFVAIGAYAACFLVLGAFVPALEQRSRSTGSNRLGAQAGILLRRPRFQSVLLFVYVRLWLHGAWTTFFPVLLIQGGRTATFAATMLAVRAGMASVCSFLTGHAQRYLSNARLTVVALSIGLLGLALSSVVDLNGAAVVVPAVLVGISSGLSLPLLLIAVGEAVPSEHRGLGFGIRNTVSQAANALAPMLSGALAGLLGLRPTFVVAAAIGGGVVAVGVVLHRR